MPADEISYIDLVKEEKRVLSQDGTTKFLFSLADGQMIETVLMRHDFGQTVCVTSQVGCNMGCRFCASGQLRKIRNLSDREMIAQVKYVDQYLRANADLMVTHIVVMGIGEPLDNYDHLISFLRYAIDPRGMEIAPRRITVSTCGIVPKIRAFAKEKLPVKLAISLHGANQETRSQIMPINRSYPLEDLLQAVEEYIQMTGKRVALEYILIDGVNDTITHAYELVKKLKRFGNRIMVNLIPYNEVEGNPYRRSMPQTRDAFFQVLVDGGIYCLRRKERGADIDAACGQLRSKHL